MKRGAAAIVILIVLLSSCTKSKYYLDQNQIQVEIQNGYFINGVGEWERAYTWERWEPEQYERTQQTFSIGDSTKWLQPGSYEAIEWIENRRQRLASTARSIGKNEDWYIDRNIEEGERR